jgi:hypothetical protein
MQQRMRKRRVRAVTVAGTTSDQRNGDAVKRLGDAWQSIRFYGSSEKQLGHLSYLERERRRWWRSANRNNHNGGYLYRTQ